MKYFFNLFLLMLLLLPVALTAQEENPVVKFYMFTSEECENCQQFKEHILPSLEENYNIEYINFDIDNNENFELLLKFEKQYGKEDNEVPVIFIGDKVIDGLNFEFGVEEAIQEYASTGVDYPKLQHPSDNRGQKQGKTTAPIHIAYFFKVGCNHCDRTQYDLKALQDKFPQIEVRKYDMATNESMRINEAMCQFSNVPDELHQASPMLFIGSNYLVNEDAKYTNILPIVERYLETGTQAPWEQVKPLLEKTEEKIIGRFESFGIFTIIFAGFIDGINPCAFATIIFFISYLTLLGRKGKEVILIGTAYTLAVFITYFTVGILGLGMLEFIQKLKILTYIVDGIFLITGGLVLIFAAFSIRDYFLYKQGKTSEMALQLPKSIKQKIHKVIREKSRATHFVLAAFTIGFLFSLQELFCTGQVYLPTLIYMSRLSHYRMLAFMYLILYNLLFIVPLVVVFMMVYWGITSDVIGAWMKKNLGVMKILMAIIFLALGIILIGSVIF